MNMRSFSNLATLFLALAGCVVAGVLTYEEFHPKADIGCSRMGGDCSKTVQSSYGHVGPIPTSLFGLAMYGAVAGLCLARHRVLRERRAAELSRAAQYAGSLREESPEAAPDAHAELEPGVSLGGPGVEAPAPSAEPAADSTLALRGALKRLDGALWLIAVPAVAASWWLQYVALYILCSFCPWCFASAVLVTLIFLLTTYDFLLEGRKLEGEQKLLAGISAFILICFGFVFAPVVLARVAICGVQPPPATVIETVDRGELLVTPYLRFRGDPNAKYMLIEFADYQCPHCKKASARVEELMKTPPPGGVKLAFRNFPLDQHVWARPAAMAAEAAGEQGKFWEMHDMIFAHQADMEKSDFSDSQIVGWAAQLGLDLTRFKKDMASPKVSDRIVTDHVAGDANKIKYTPSFYLITPAHHVTLLSGLEGLEAAWNNMKGAAWK